MHSRGSESSHSSGSAYAQISAKIDKLEKSNQKLKCAQKKCKRSHESDSTPTLPEELGMVVWGIYVKK